MVRYYTRTGDAGQTSLYTGERIAKTSLRVEAYGTVDELQSFMGLARSLAGDPEIDADLEAVEGVLSAAMAQLASTDGRKRVTQEDVDAVEALCDKYTERASAWKPKFVLPGASPASGALHVARAVARRAERCVLRYAECEAAAPVDSADPVDPVLLKYLNRISDLLYAMAVCVDFQNDAL